MADQFRHDALSANGGFANTPHLDAIASEGVLFNHCFTTSPKCIPARISLALGHYPHQTGVWDNINFTLSPDAPTWMRAVRNAGYRTSVFGKTHLHPQRGDLREREPLLHAYGLDDVHEVAGPHSNASVQSYMTDLWEEHAVYSAYKDDIQRRKQNRSEVRPSVLPLDLYYDVYVGRKSAEYLKAYDRPEPWMCWVSFPGPHDPWDAPPPYDTMYDPANMPLPIPAGKPDIESDCVLKDLLERPGQHRPHMTPEHVARLRANYAGNVTLIDDQIGMILDVLRTRGALDDTLVVFTSDHGEMNGDHGLLLKSNFLDPAVRIPFIVRPPRGFPSGMGDHHSASLTEIIDVGATLMDYAGAVVPTSFGGQSLRPLMEGRSYIPRTSIISEFKGEIMLADSSWKIVVDTQGRPVLLFDRVHDPDELVNLADDLANRETLQVLLARLRQKCIPTERY